MQASYSHRLRTNPNLKTVTLSACKLMQKNNTPATCGMNLKNRRIKSSNPPSQLLYFVSAVVNPQSSLRIKNSSSKMHELNLQTRMNF